MLKQTRFVIALLAFCVVVACAALAFAQAHGGAVGAPQQFLAKRAGEYTRVIRFVGQPGEWKGTSKISLILGGRFIMEDNRDTVMGKPVEGIRILGYDDASKRYEMISMYTMSTGITKFTGTSADGGRTVRAARPSAAPRTHSPGQRQRICGDPLRPRARRQVQAIPGNDLHPREVILKDDGRRVSILEAARLPISKRYSGQGITNSRAAPRVGA
jgi:hypothetical protein